MIILCNIFQSGIWNKRKLKLDFWDVNKLSFYAYARTRIAIPMYHDFKSPFTTFLRTFIGILEGGIAFKRGLLLEMLLKNDEQILCCKKTSIVLKTETVN